MVAPWDTTSEPASYGAEEGIVTLIEGSSFVASGSLGNIHAERPQGLFFADTRFLSRWELRIDGGVPEALGTIVGEPFSGQFVQRLRPRPGHADAELVVIRQRWIGNGMREDITIENFSDKPVRCPVELHLGADFADLFEVKEGRVRTRGEYRQEFVDGAFAFEVRRSGQRRGLGVTFSEPPLSGPQVAIWEPTIPAHGRWHVCVHLTLRVGDETVEPRYRCGQPVERAVPHERMTAWRQEVPRLATDHRPLEVAVRQSAEDLGILRIFDPASDQPTVAAGAPWFMTLFGRDSLLTAWMALLADPDLALGVLQTLAAHQGTKRDPATEEEPGKILHEIRFGTAGVLALGGGAYYGTVDATPLFVMLLGELRRWGLDDERVDALLPHADRALEWIEEYGDRDGDGYVEYHRLNPNGLLHQGWKDSWDGVRFDDGRFAETPIALCEVQGYVYAAYVARAHFAEEAGDTGTAARYGRKAADLKARFNRDFWLPERGWFALGLDRDKQPIDSLASNMGHALWCGIVDEEKAALVADRLLSPEMFSGWGIRTLGSSMGAYNPVSYHNGSVWPHDNAITAAGLMRYGFVEHAQRVILAILDAAAAEGGRLPEVFCGFPRSHLATPVRYPTSCSPQAWAAASPLLFLRTLLRFDPWSPHGKLWCAPALPPEIRRLRVDGIQLAGARITVDVVDGEARFEGLPEDIQLVAEPRQPLNAYLTAPLG